MRQIVPRGALGLFWRRTVVRKLAGLIGPGPQRFDLRYIGLVRYNLSRQLDVSWDLS
jgi:hypothetical protein